MRPKYRSTTSEASVPLGGIPGIEVEMRNTFVHYFATAIALSFRNVRRNNMLRGVNIVSPGAGVGQQGSCNLSSEPGVLLRIPFWRVPRSVASGRYFILIFAGGLVGGSPLAGESGAGVLPE